MPTAPAQVAGTTQVCRRYVHCIAARTGSADSGISSNSIVSASMFAGYGLVEYFGERWDAGQGTP
jgi:hypothetical protein